MQCKYATPIDCPLIIHIYSYSYTHFDLCFLNLSHEPLPTWLYHPPSTSKPTLASKAISRRCRCIHLLICGIAHLLLVIVVPMALSLFFLRRFLFVVCWVLRWRRTWVVGVRAGRFRRKYVGRRWTTGINCQSGFKQWAARRIQTWSGVSASILRACGHPLSLWRIAL